MTRLRQGWALTKKSWILLRSRPGLARFPALGALVTLLPLAGLAGPGLYLMDTENTALGVLLLALGLYLTALVATFFGVAIAAAADRAFRDEDVTMGTGFAVARSRLGAIAGWALISTIIGTLMSVLESQRGLAAPLVGMLGGAAWGLVTFLAIPVIAIEGLGPVATVQRSASLFRERWRGQVTGTVTIGGAVALLGMLPAIGLVVLGAVLWGSDGNGAELALGAVIVAVGVVLFCASAVIAHTLRQLFGVALYRYTADGSTVAGFTEDELSSAVRRR